ncbi:hypothetical protein Hena1_00520 [Erwinia phage Hena1]|uniref:Uncharacterized protein n=1 Tax=Erwinia phage Hena1 TaxID=2678601 RepID=A0A6B9J645_9CAUD|nr:hypothetical protein HWC84_gp051 [Erwinia phage Hena1]QGZ16228.1 hypothetical protein Hena1_00520 [Erwinia phage Hena1]
MNEQTKPAPKKRATQHISVTIDLLRTFPDLDVTKDADLHVALYRVGFDAQKDEATGLIALSPFTMLPNKNVRCADKPYMYRKTLIFAGNMRPGFKQSKIYNNIDILDVGMYSGLDAELVSDLPYDLPVTEKVNTRKYTKKGERDEFVRIDFTPEDEGRLYGIFGEGD